MRNDDQRLPHTPYLNNSNDELINMADNSTSQLAIELAKRLEAALSENEELISENDDLEDETFKLHEELTNG